MIDLLHFNSVSPYKALPSIPDGFYEFITDFGVRYSIGFMYDDSIITSGAYQFIISNVNNQASPNDDKVRQTIICMIDEFFCQNEDVLLYICETGDGKQAMRNRLFQYWFSKYDKKDDFTFLSSSVTEADGIVNYATIIIRSRSPRLTEVVTEFTETMRLFQEKPDL